ncbi:MAG: tetratricopeptide repeat protein, partial [Chloroflexota bacterium]
MADIALRSYLEEIDRMVDSNQVDEAIAHAKYILGIYPKNLEAYKVLAKCLLEKNRHIDAADIFQRVLSAVPDDFVSHIGMSIAREDESNLDAAIWHMERAFEVQPSSGPVQEELKRLHGKREGMEPPKVRLTRGALARLYQKGHHYQQAIAELQAAITEEPDRYDLKALLAQALWHANRLEEATEACNKILETLPFCREANRILALVWSESGREAEAKIYHKRLEALDPYEAYSNLRENGSGAGKVPADNVHIPRLDYVPAAQTEVQDTSRPGWMQSVGVQFDQPQASTDAPDWLSGLNIAGASAESETAPIAEVPAPSTTESNDDWLNTFTSSAPSAAVEEAAAPAQDALPDWLGSSGVAATTPQAEAPAQTDWLNTLGATPEPQKQSGTGWLKEIEERKQREATAALTPDAAPSWMDQPAADATPSWLDQP